MLKFKETNDSYQVIEILYDPLHDTVKTVEYKKDLSEKRLILDNWIEPWRKTVQSDRNWFKKYYLHKYK